jgi:hypothetical protein
MFICLCKLAPLKAIVRRCAPFLEELHLHGDFQMRFGHIRIFFPLAHPFGRLAHLHIDVHLDSWHLRKIQRHLAPQLLSLAVVPYSTDKSLIAFKELLANCNKVRKDKCQNNQCLNGHFEIYTVGKSPHCQNEALS